MIRFIDLTGQTLFILLGIWCLVYHWGATGWPFQLLIVQLLLGPWQMVSCLAGLFSEDSNTKLQWTQLALVVVYFVVLAAAICIAPWIRNGYSDAMAAVYMVVIPWILAIYYYKVTWRLVFPDAKK